MSRAAPSTSYLRAPGKIAVVRARDHADVLLTPPGSLEVLDRYVDRVEAAMQGRPPATPAGQLLLLAGRHPVTKYSVSAYRDAATEDVLAASKVGESAGAVAALAGGLDFDVVNAGWATGDLLKPDALSAEQVSELIERGRSLGAAVGSRHVLQASGKVGVGNTTVAATLAAALLDLPASEVVGLGCVLAGAVLGAASTGAVSVLDGPATSVAALPAFRIVPGAAGRRRGRRHAGQRLADQRAEAASGDWPNVSMMELLLVRYGESTWNVAGRMQGQTASPAHRPWSPPGCRDRGST